MSFPNLPSHGGQPRDVARAVNHLLNRVSYLTVFADGMPTAAQQLLRVKLPVPLVIVDHDSIGDAGTAPTADAVFAVKIDGVSAGTLTFPAGQASATVSITTKDVPALSLLEVYAPSPQDASLADVTLSLAVSR